MINLLPPEEKRQINAGKTNVLLWRYCIFSILLAILLAGVTGGVYYIMMNSKKEATATIDIHNQESQKYSKTQQDISAFSANLKTAKAILDKNVRYSDISVKIAKSLPSDIVLQSLDLNAKNFGTPTILNALGKSYSSALRLKDSLEKSDVFKNVRLVSINQTPPTTDGYTYTIAVNVTINPEVTKQ